jgi:hypothetical protein
MKRDPIDVKRENVTEELLLCLLRPVATEESTQRVEQLMQESADWSYLIELADSHRVVPLLHRRLTPFAGRVPKPHVTKLQQRFRTISFANLALTGKLLKLLALLREHDIPAISYKGPALAQAAYGDINLRQFTDLDILSRKQDIRKIKELLLRNGCQPAWRLTQAQEAAVLRLYYEYPFVWTDGGKLIEIHWEFAESFFSFAFDIEEIFARSETIEICGNPVRTLCREDSLVVLCAHGSKHLWGRLSWICDIAQTVSGSREPDWDLLIERARKLRLRRILWLGLLLANNLLGAKLPDEVMRHIRAEPKIDGLAQQIRRGLFRNAKEESGTVRTTLLQLSMRERMRDKFAYSFRLVVMTKLIDSLFMPMGRPR